MHIREQHEKIYVNFLIVATLKYVWLHLSLAFSCNTQVFSWSQPFNITAKNIM